MKKILTSTAVVAAVAALSGALVACGDKGGNNNGKTDQQIADEAISVIRTLYADKAELTQSDYTVNGVQPVDGKSYNIKWTVSSEFANFEEYVKVGEMNDKKQVPITIKKATEEIEYTLTATVNVGKASASEDFKRKIPAGLEQGDDEISQTIDFSSVATRDSYSTTQQIWKQNGITVTNDKGASTTNVDNAWQSSGDNKHIRFYKDSTVTIAYPGMTKLLFYSTAAYTSGDKTTDYPGFLKTSLEAAGLGTVTADTENNTVTLTLAVPMDSITFTAGAGQIRLTTLDVVANTNGTTDQNKVDGAKLQLNLAKTNYTLAGTYDLPAKQGDVNVTWAVATNDYAVIENGKLKVNSLPETEAELTLTATLTLNGATATKEIKVKVTNAGVENDGSEEHPYTAAEAWKIANMGSTEEVYVTGYVALPGTYAGTTFNNFDNMYITDSYDAATDYSYSGYTGGEYIGLFYIYRPKAEGEFLTSAGLNAGDLVTFKGNLANYNSKSPQLANGVCVARTEPERTDVEDALLAVKSTLTVTTTGETALPASTVAGVTFTWSTEDTTYTVTDNKLNVAELPTTPATVTLTVSATDGTETKTKTVTVTIKAPTNYGTETAPLSVAAAVAIADAECATKDLVSAEVVWMTGIVADVSAASNGFYNYIIRDAADASKTILVYTKPENVRTDVTAPAQNDVVVVSGYIKNYNGTKEFASNSGTYVYFEKNTRGTSTITVEAGAGATVTGLSATATNGTEATFKITMEEGKDLVSVKVNGTALTADAEGNYKFTVAGNMKVDVETKGEGEVAPTTASITFSEKGYTNAQTVTDTKIDIDANASVTFAKGTGSSEPAYYNTGTGMRAYGGNTITISVPAGYVISKITFTWTNESTEIKVDSGTLTDKVWQGSAQSVVFTNSGTSGHYRIQTIEVSYKAVAGEPATESDTTTTVALPEAIVDEQ